HSPNQIASSCDRKRHVRWQGFAHLATLLEHCRGAKPSATRREEAMEAGTRTNLEVVPLTKHIGAEIRGVDLRETLDEGAIGLIHQAWLDHVVLVFRGQRFAQEDLVRATGYFGEIGPLSRPAKYFPKGYDKLLPNIMLISNIRENGEVIGAL